MAKQDPYIVGIDIGTSKVCAIIAEADAEGFIEVIGVGSAESKGVRKGAVVNLDATTQAVRHAVEEAESLSGLAVNAAFVGLGGANIKGYNSRGVVAISSRNREISEADKQRVIDQARAVSIPPDREIIEVLPQEYTVDDQDGIGDPVGMLGMRLSVDVHIVTSPITARQNVITSITRSGLLVLDTVLAPMAAAEATLSDDEKEFGVALIDIGGETTSLAIFHRGTIRHTAVFPLGGSHLTNDIAVGLRTPFPEAERIKREYGCAISNRAVDLQRGNGGLVEVPSVGGRAPRTLSREILCDILQPRAEEILSLVHNEIVRAGYERQLCSGVVLTGGGAMMDGMAEVTEQILDLPVRYGIPEGVGGLTERISAPAFATAVGLVLYGYRKKMSANRAPARQQAGALARAASRIKGWLGNFF